MNIFKKVAISILAVVVSLCPTMTLFGNTTSVSAAYISDTDNDMECFRNIKLFIK